MSGGYATWIINTIKQYWQVFNPDDIRYSVIGYECDITIGDASPVFCGNITYSPRESKAHWSSCPDGVHLQDNSQFLVVQGSPRPQVPSGNYLRHHVLQVEILCQLHLIEAGYFGHIFPYPKMQQCKYVQVWRLTLLMVTWLSNGIPSSFSKWTLVSQIILCWAYCLNENICWYTFWLCQWSSHLRLNGIQHQWRMAGYGH